MLRYTYADDVDENSLLPCDFGAVGMLASLHTNLVDKQQGCGDPDAAAQASGRQRLRETSV